MRKLEREDYRGFKLQARRPKGMKLFSVVVSGPKTREILNCRKRFKEGAIDHGKQYIDERIEFKERQGKR